MAQVALRGGGRPIPCNFQDQAGGCSEHPDLAEGVHIHCSEVGTRRPLHSSNANYSVIL